MLITRFNSLRDGGGQLDLGNTEYFVLAVLLVGQLYVDKGKQSQPWGPTFPSNPDSDLLLGVLLPIMPSCLKKHGSKRVTADSWDSAHIAKGAVCV